MKFLVMWRRRDGVPVAPGAMAGVLMHGAIGRREG